MALAFHILSILISSKNNWNVKLFKINSLDKKINIKDQCVIILNVCLWYSSYIGITELKYWKWLQIG